MSTAQQDALFRLTGGDDSETSTGQPMEGNTDDKHGETGNENDGNDESGGEEGSGDGKTSAVLATSQAMVSF